MSHKNKCAIYRPLSVATKAQILVYYKNRVRPRTTKLYDRPKEEASFEEAAPVVF
jgi:hypothetical protein